MKKRNVVVDDRRRKELVKLKPYDVVKQKFQNVVYSFKEIKGKKYITLYSYVSVRGDSDNKRLFEKVRFSNKRRKTEEYKKRVYLKGTFHRDTKVEIFNERAKKTNSLFFMKESKTKSHVVPYKKINKKVVRDSGEVQTIGFFKARINGQFVEKIYRGTSSKSKVKKGVSKIEEAERSAKAQMVNDGLPYEGLEIVRIKTTYNAYL